jgi:hypothetical protein
MNKPFLKQLAKLSDVDFIMLEHHLHVARQVRNLYNRDGLSIEVICEKLSIDPNDFNNVILGAYTFDLKFLSKLQSFIESIYREKAVKQAESEGIQFAKYKHS